MDIIFKKHDVSILSLEFFRVKGVGFRDRH